MRFQKGKMDLYKIHNLLWWCLVILIPSTLYVALFINNIVGQIMYIIMFCISMVMIGIKKKVGWVGKYGRNQSNN